MNSFILMAKVARNPELRYTQDTQIPVSQMLVEFEGGKPEDPPCTLKVVGWNKLAEEIQQKYTEGDHIIIEGRLSMIMFDRPDGLKEKRAELVASRIYPLDSSAAASIASAASVDDSQPAANPRSEKVVSMDTYKPSKPFAPSSYDDLPMDFSVSPATENEASETNLDEIPF